MDVSRRAQNDVEGYISLDQMHQCEWLESGVGTSARCHWLIELLADPIDVLSSFAFINNIRCLCSLRSVFKVRTIYPTAEKATISYAKACFNRVLPRGINKDCAEFAIEIARKAHG